MRRWSPQARLVVVGDSTYAALKFLHACQTVTVITRLRLDAPRYEPAPPYPGKRRPRKKGQRLPPPQQTLDDPLTGWFHYGLPAVPIRGVLIRDVAGKFEPQALVSTDLSLTPEQLLTFFLHRWQYRTNLSTGSHPSGCRNSAAMVGSDDCPHDPHLVGVVFVRDPAGSSSHCPARRTATLSGLVSQNVLDFFRYLVRLDIRVDMRTILVCCS